MNDLNRFDKFTERARRVLNFAGEEAQRFNHNYVGTEHLLLGLIREEEGVAAKVLSKLGVEPINVRIVIEYYMNHADRIGSGERGMTRHAKKAIELAVEEAVRLNHHYVGTEHLLLGLVREGEDIAASVLASLGVNLEKVRTQVSLVLSQSSGTPGAAPNRSKTPFLDKMCMDLTAAARDGKLDPISGREKEIERVIQILSRRLKNNPTLIGESEAGKTAIVEGLAQKIVAGEVSETLADKRLIKVDVGSLVAGTRYRGESEERLKKIIEEACSSGDCILFIDQLHALVSGYVANFVKPALSRGELQCIGIITLDDYRKYIERDQALRPRFQEVIVHEATVEETIDIPRGIPEKQTAEIAAAFGAAAPVSAAAPPPVRTGAFISYSHKDKEYLERLRVHLRAYERAGALNVWDDTKIAVGARWREEIRRALEAARVAILLISADFLASDFIADNELPPLLAAAQEEGAVVIPIILKHCAFEDSELGQFQAVENAQPLIDLSEGRREEVWTKVARLVREALKTAEVHAKGSDSA
jgi:hypothetical protein